MHGPHWLSKSSVSPCVYRDHPPQRADRRAYVKSRNNIDSFHVGDMLRERLRLGDEPPD